MLDQDFLGYSRFVSAPQQTSKQMQCRLLPTTIKIRCMAKHVHGQIYYCLWQAARRFNTSLQPNDTNEDVHGFS